jgi:hypothetical protein
LVPCWYNILFECVGTAETLEPQGFEPGLWAARFLCPHFFFRVCVFPPADNFNLALNLQDYILVYASGPFVLSQATFDD